MSQMNLSLSLRSRLLMGTAVVDAYAVEGFKPNLVFDFDDEYYRTNSTVSTFDDSITHSASTRATMVDSDGVLKWRPHNLLKYSEDITNAAWFKSTGTSATDAETFDFSGDTTNGRVSAFLSVAIGTKITFSFEMKAASSGTVTASLLYTNGTRVNLNCNLTAEWQTFSFTTVINNFIGAVYLVDCRAGAPTGGITAVNVRAIRCYRSDLGGMVNNPDTGNSYVPTTSAARYLPRRGHHVWNGSAWVNEGLLHESEARTNLLPYSNDFSSGTGAWTVNAGASVSDDAAVSPDGGTNADLFIPSTSSAFQSIQESYTFTQGTAYTFSFFAKASGYSWVRARFYFNALSCAQLFDVANGVKGTTANNNTGNTVTSNISDVGGGWYRVDISCAAPVISAAGNVSINVHDGDNGNQMTGDGTSGILIYGAQLEVGSTPSSYIPTSGSTVTRAAETLTIPAAKLPYSATAMSIQMDGRITFADNENINQARVVGWNESANNYNSISLSTTDANVGTSNVGEFRYAFRSSAGSVESLYSGVELPIGTFKGFSVATRALGNGTTGGVINIAQSGTAAVEEAFAATGGVLPDLSATNLNLGSTYMGTIRRLRMWNQDITDAGIEAASVTAPLLFGLPTISGNTNQGATLTASSAPVVIGTPTPTTTWQWLRDGAPISGATSNTYVLTGDDVGSKISVRQTATNVGGTASATSAETATISAVPAGAIAQRDGAYILDRAGNYIEVRA